MTMDTTPTPEGAAPAVSSAGGSDRASRRWRSLWRVHFYAGMFAMPFIVLMALSGLVILYTQPIQDTLQGDLRSVAAQGEWVSFDQQEQAVEAAYPEMVVVSMTVPVDAHHATVFGLDDGSAVGQQVFVDPYTSEVLGIDKPGSDVVGLANRLHGFLNIETVTIDLPTVSALWDDGAVMRPYVVGDLVLELLGVWTLVLVLSGLYLWWPRRSRWGGAERSGRRLFGLRFAKAGRARWRDLHGLAGVVLLGAMLITLVSGMAWSAYWGPNFASLANEITPNSWTDAPASSLGERGDLDRLGNRIPWNTGDRPIPASYSSDVDLSLPTPISLDTVVAIAEQEGMKPGYSVYFPANASDEAGNPVYGSFTLSNSWPRTTGEGRDLYLDQFNGSTLAEQTGWGYGAISYGVDTLVSTHMGTQLGLFSRIMMTAMCVLAIWSVISASVMYWKRRRKGTLGLPRRPIDVRLAKGVGVIACGLAVMFPLWGVTAMAILALDRFVIRKVRPLRVAFGQR